MNHRGFQIVLTWIWVTEGFPDLDVSHRGFQTVLTYAGITEHFTLSWLTKLQLHWGQTEVQSCPYFATRLVLLAPCHQHSTPFLEKLHWLSISERVKYEVACTCFNAINGFGPAYRSELLHVYTPSHTLCSSSDTRMLKIQQYKHKSHGFCAFPCFGPHIWNWLPQDLRHCSTLSSFKAKLKTFLFSQYFHTN